MSDLETRRAALARQIAATRSQRLRAEDLNNEILVPYFEALSAAERSELTELLVSIRNDIDM